MILPALGLPVSRCLTSCLAILVTASAAAFQPEAGHEGQRDSGHGRTAPVTLPATGTVQAAFTPGDDAGKLIIDAIDAAQHQVLVQAFSFTHRKIADSLIAASRRGVDVKVISDKDQIHRIRTSLISKMAADGVPVFTDSAHDSAHNKVIVIDAGSPAATLITGECAADKGQCGADRSLSEKLAAPLRALAALPIALAVCPGLFRQPGFSQGDFSRFPNAIRYRIPESAA
jgi:hypothetical protein